MQMRRAIALSAKKTVKQASALQSVHAFGCPCCGPVAAAHKAERRTVLHTGQDRERLFSSSSLPFPSASINSVPAESAFEVATSAVRFGPGVTREVGFDAAQMAGPGGRVALFTDPHLAELAKSDPNSAVAVALASLTDAGVKYDLFNRVRCEPTDESFREAIAWASRDGGFDCFVAVGGGSVIDTAKAANLYSTYPVEDFLDYVNPPIGNGKVIPGPLRPLIAVPTTAGTGSEATGVSIFDYQPLHAKTGIASRLLKPALGIVDPNNTATLTPEITAASGFDVLCHALESYTAVPFNKRGPRPEHPSLRPAYQGSNPIADIWSLRALEMTAKNLVRAFDDPSDFHARQEMILASTAAGVGFGSAGVHLPHGMSYPIAGRVKMLASQYRHPGYPVEYPLVPHGISVIMNAPAVFRFTAVADPERHLRCAEILGGGPKTVEARRTAMSDPSAAGEYLAEVLLTLMRRLNVPDGLKALGYTENNIPELVAGTIPQHRVTKLAPRETGSVELTKLFTEGLTLY